MLFRLSSTRAGANIGTTLVAWGVPVAMCTAMACGSGTSTSTPVSPSSPAVTASNQPSDGPARLGTASARDDLLPRTTLFGNPDLSTVRLSSDGKYISYLAPKDGIMNVWVAPIDSPLEAKVITSETKRNVRSYTWAQTSEHVVYAKDDGGDENYHLVAVHVASGKETPLTPQGKVRSSILGVSYKHPQYLLVDQNDRDPKWHDIYRVNVTTGESELVYQNNEEFGDFVSDTNLDVRLASKEQPDGTIAYYDISADVKTSKARHGKGFPHARQAANPQAQPDSAPKRQPILVIPYEDSLVTGLWGFNDKGDIAYMVDSRGRNTAALSEFNLKTGKTKVVAFDDLSDIRGVVIQPRTRKLQAAISNHMREKVEVLDSSIQPDLDYLKTVNDGELQLVGRTLNDDRWLVAFTQDRGPVRYYRYDRQVKKNPWDKVKGEPGKATYLFSNRKALENARLAPMRPVLIPSRDGLDLVSYLTLPLESAPKQGLVPTKRLPMVLRVHGGPWSRDVWGYHPYHQWLANRGYAVLSVNFRGSTGFGKAFINAADRQWAGRMHDDLIDAVNWAIDREIALPDKVAIVGGSYGGYATLVGLTFTPTVFACGVDIVGPSNLLTLIETIPPYWSSATEMLARRVGDKRTEQGKTFLRERSPLSRVDQIVRPLLIGQGANDPRVKRSESDQIVKAMQDKQIPVTYVLYPDEGHGFANAPNNLSFSAVSEVFLAQCLSGVYQPFGDDLKGSSIQVLTGKENVQGLADALAGKATPSGQ